MSEPSSIKNGNLQRVNYTVNLTGNQGSAIVRRNRTAEETAKQFDRLVRDFNISENPTRYLRLSNAFTRTMRALSATGRQNPYFNPMYGAKLNRK